MRCKTVMSSHLILLNEVECPFWSHQRLCAGEQRRRRIDPAVPSSAADESPNETNRRWSLLLRRSN
jgi:hypothetical protein